MNSINRFWNGDVSLPKSYWLIGWLLAFPIIVGSFTIMDYHFYFGAALLVIWIGFSTVGIWRSSDKYEGKKAWAVLTKIWLSINITYFPCTLIGDPVLFSLFIEQRYRFRF